MKALVLFILFLNSCAEFTPLYENKKIFLENLKDATILTDNKKMSQSIKKNLLKKMPPSNNNIKFIIKIETEIENNSTVTSTDRKTSGYEIVTNAIVSLYKRDKYDKLIFSFKEISVVPYELSPNQVLSTLASRNRVFDRSSIKLSKSILDRLMLYFSKINYNDNKG
tara:strand:- start:123 stop:623 length:501 start_codon:yes stop_codon:yes gene_type:complete